MTKSEEDVVIREAILEDLDAIQSLSDQINRQHHAEAPEVFAAVGARPEAQRSFWHRYIQGDSKIIQVAVSGNGVIGFVSALIDSEPSMPFLADHILCRINTIVVDEALQGLGVGAKLLRAIEDWSTARGATEARLVVMEFNQSAQRFYDREGYSVQSRTLAKPLATIASERQQQQNQRR